MSQPIETVAMPVPVALSPSLIRELHAPHSLLRTTIERCGSAVVLCAGGEVDTSNLQIWQQLLSEAAALTAAPGPLVVDTNGLNFMAVCAFAALAQQADRCRLRGIKLCLASRQPIVARCIAGGGLATQLPLYPSIDAAVTAL